METKQTVETLDENWIANDPGYLLRWRFCFFKALINITKTGQLSGTDDDKWCRNCTFLCLQNLEKVKYNYRISQTHMEEKRKTLYMKKSGAGVTRCCQLSSFQASSDLVIRVWKWTH